MELAHKAIACQAGPGLPPWEGNVFDLEGRQTMSRSHVLIVLGFFALELRSPFLRKNDEGRMADARLL